jgi:hypothetical protein
LLHVLRLKQIRATERFIIDAMTAFHLAVVTLAPQGVTPQVAAQGYQEATAQFRHML